MVAPFRHLFREVQKIIGYYNQSFYFNAVYRSRKIIGRDGNGNIFATTRRYIQNTFSAVAYSLTIDFVFTLLMPYFC